MKKSIALILAILMIISLCACGSTSKTQYASTASAVAPASAPMAAMGASYNEDISYAADAEMIYDGLASNGTNTVAADGGAEERVDPEKIIYSASATVETTEFDNTITALNDMINSYKGWVESSRVTDNNYYNKSRGSASSRSASYTIRIPSEHFSTLMNSLTTLGNVPSTYTYTENVTAKYYDTQARLTAYQAQEARLIEMLALAESVEDIITIEDKLSEVRYMIESHQSTLKNWDRRVSYSTVDIEIREVQVYTPTPEKKMGYGERLAKTFVSSIEDMGEFLQNLLVFIVSAIPTLVLLAVLLLVCRPIITKLMPKLKARRAARKRAKSEKKNREKDDKTEAAE